MMEDNILKRRADETEAQHHKRLLEAKLVDKTLEYDYSEIAPYLYGKNYAPDVARRMAYGSLRTLKIMEDAAISRIRESESEEILSEIDMKTIELRKQRQRFFDQRTAFNKLVRERSRQEELNDIVFDAIAGGGLPQLSPPVVKKSVPCSDSDLLVSLNDIHYGASYSNYWGEYNPDVTKEMMQRYLDKTIEIAKTHKSENCIVWENGDAISGAIHRSIQVTNKENVVSQVVGVSELVSTFLAGLSPYFKQVTFVSVSGNHSRIEANKKDALVEDRLDDLIDWYVEARLQNFKNIKVARECRIDPTMYLIDIRGKNYCGVHGDFDGSATKIQALQTMVGKPLYAVLTGHMHHNAVDVIQGIKTVMAGSFLGTDDYCVQRRIFGRPEQMVCVCDKNGIVCHYDISLLNQDPREG